MAKMSYITIYADTHYRFSNRVSKRFAEPKNATTYLRKIAKRIDAISQTPDHFKITHLKNVVRICFLYGRERSNDVLRLLYKSIPRESIRKEPKLNFIGIIQRVNEYQKRTAKVPPLLQLAIIAQSELTVVLPVRKGNRFDQRNAYALKQTEIMREGYWES
jgi:hypothetical protein